MFELSMALGVGEKGGKAAYLVLLTLADTWQVQVLNRPFLLDCEAISFFCLNFQLGHTFLYRKIIVRKMILHCKFVYNCFDHTFVADFHGFFHISPCLYNTTYARTLKISIMVSWTDQRQRRLASLVRLSRRLDDSMVFHDHQSSLRHVIAHRLRG